MSLNGILNIYKPSGMTSFDVVRQIKILMKTGKVGHAGTLDPAATGVLPVCTGYAVKAMEFLIEKDKLYRAELTLGMTTDTEDTTGNVVSVKPVNIDSGMVYEVIQSFRGKSKQVPPMYSAVRQDGKRLYDLARKGISVERKPREIEIYSIEIKEINLPKVVFDVLCSKGTYIRTLCADIGERLGCGGCMSSLLRLKAGIFDIKDSLSLDEINGFHKEGILEEKMTRVEDLFTDLKSVKLSSAEVKKFRNGVILETCPDSFAQGEIISVYDDENSFFALGEIIARQNCFFIRSKKFFIGH